MDGNKTRPGAQRSKTGFERIQDGNGVNTGGAQSNGSGAGLCYRQGITGAGQDYSTVRKTISRNAPALVGVLILLCSVLHYYPPNYIVAKRYSYPRITAHEHISNEVAKHKLQCIAAKAAVIDTLGQ